MASPRRSRPTVGVVLLEPIGIVRASLRMLFDAERDPLWLIRSIRDRSPQLTILATGTDLTHSAISQALFVGADGYVHKNSPPERFLEATPQTAGAPPSRRWPHGARARPPTRRE